MSDFNFEIIGSGNLSASIHARFSNCNNVLLSGWQPHEYVLNKMSMADIFLFPSTLEGLPNVLVEALSMGAVPVASNLESGVTDIIENGVNGILVEPGNVDDFSNAILNLYNNPGRLRFLKSNAGISLRKFEPYSQADVYERLIIKTSKKENAGKRIYPSYRKGRVLDMVWLPNNVVIRLRKIFRNPKL